ncbi:MAG TPA: nucleoside-diphosphate sugar epimerase/dehydratase, partial [Petrotogaceae bacterium]|nr:nucleoside-diphosphate sugar epimerase/dehydratase [Petrotogaceae bacterium]
MKYMAKRKLTLLLIDYVLFVCAYGISMFIRFQLDFAEMSKYISPIFLYALIMVTTLYLSRIYESIWRFATLPQLLPVFYSAGLGFLVNLFIFEFLRRYVTSFFILPFTVNAITSLTGVILIAWSRIYWFSKTNKSSVKETDNNILIIGAGEIGVQILDEFERRPGEGTVVGFLDYDHDKIGRSIRGYKVFDVPENTMKYIDLLKIKEVIVAISNINSADLRKLLSFIDTKKVRVRILPGMFEVLNNKASLGILREVDVTDLLGRKEVKVDLKEISEYISGKNILITGAGGSIGSEICRQVAVCAPKELYILGRGENSIFNIKNELNEKFPQVKTTEIICDITDEKRLGKIFERFSFDVVFHAAAHKHVPLMEKNPTEAFKVNVLGTYSLAKLAIKHEIKKFIFISTDKAIKPTSIMGCSKRFAEEVIRSFSNKTNTVFGMVRFGNVVGSRGSVIPIFKNQIAKGGPVKVTDPRMKRYFMTIPEAVTLVLQCMIFSSGGEVFILDMGEPILIDNLARELIRLSGLVPDQDIKIEYTGIRPGEKLYE